MVLLGRVLFGFVLVGGLRLAWRLVPGVALGLAALAVWPSVLLAVGLRRWALPEARLRWASLRPDLCLSAAALGLVVALVLVGEAGRAQGADAYKVGVLVPLALPLGLLERDRTLVWVGRAVPWWVAGGVLLAWGWPAYGFAVRAVRPFQRGDALPGGGTGQRTADNAPRPPVSVHMKPISAQRIATDPKVGMDWLVAGWLARGAITLLAADPKAGKTELAFALFRSAYDRQDFCGLATKPFRVLVLTEQTATTLYPFVRRYGFWRVPTGRLERWWLAYVARRGVGNAVEVVPWSSLYRGKKPGQRPTWADIAPAGIELAVRGRYDVLMVDTLGRWAAGEGGGGVASPQAMLTAMGYLHEAAERGLCVLINHHNSRAGRVMGTVSIDAEMDIILKLSRAPGPGEQAETTGRRLVAGNEGRFAEDTPPVLYVRLVREPDAPDGQPRARYVADPEGTGLALDPVPLSAAYQMEAEPTLWASPEPPRPRPAPPRSTEELVLGALEQAGRATAAQLEALVGEPLASSPRRRQAVSGAVKTLVEEGRAVQVGEATLPRGGKARVYEATGG